MAELKHTALIGDLVDSRSHPDRAAIQKALLAELDLLNQAGGIVAALELTAGDEIQGLFDARAGSSLVRVMTSLTDRLFGLEFEQRIRFGIGFGALQTDLLPSAESPRVSLLDGPCFHAAREALDDARSGGQWAQAQGFGTRESALLSSHMELLGEIRQGWTQNQAHTTLLARRHGAPHERGAQKQAAVDAGVSPSVVSQSLKAARFEAVVRGEAAAADLIELLTSRALGIPWTL